MLGSHETVERREIQSSPEGPDAQKEGWEPCQRSIWANASMSWQG